MNKLGRVLACTTLAATLTMTSLTGCGNTLDGTKTVATVGKEEITAPMVAESAESITNELLSRMGHRLNIIRRA